MLESTISPRTTKTDATPINSAFVWKIAYIAAMGGLLFGYDFMVISGATIFYGHYFGIVDAAGNALDWRLGFSVGSAPIGCILGALFSMVYSDRFGRKNLLIWSALLFGASAAGTGAAWDFISFNIFRLVGGIGIGLAANQSPMYIAETSPASYRGKVVTTNQFTIMIGIVASMVANYFIQQHGESVKVAAGALDWNDTIGWRLMFGAAFVPAVAFFALMFTVPDSPRWLIKRGRVQEARAILNIIGGEAYADREVAEIVASLSTESAARVNVREFMNPKLLKIVLLGMFLAVTQQWSGLNSVFAYSLQIFQEAGIPISGIMLSLVLQGVTMLTFCVVAMYVVDRIGRKKMMLVGTLGIAIVHFLFGMTFKMQIKGITSVILVICAIAFYAMTLAPVVWVLLAELFPNRYRGAAMGISVVALWTAYWILTFTCPIMLKHWGVAWTFWTYAIFLVIAFFVILFGLTETKGKSLEEIERELLGEPTSGRS